MELFVGFLKTFDSLNGGLHIQVEAVVAFKDKTVMM